MSVNLEALRDEWSRVTAGVLRDDWIERNRERIRKSGPMGPFALIVWIATLAMLGCFLAMHATQPALFATALVLEVWVIVTGVVGVMQQQAIRSLDYGLPLVELQARIESLRIARIRAFNWAFLTGQVVWWIPFAVVVFAALTGVDLWSHAKFVSFAAWNLGGGIAFIPLAVWVSRRYGERLSKNTVVRHIADSIAGRDIAMAKEYLEKLRRFGSAVA